MKKSLVICFALLLGAFMQPVMAQKSDVGAKFNVVLQQYYVLKNALAKDEAPAASAAAAKLQTVIKDVPHTGFSSDAQHQLWMKESALAAKSAADIAGSKDLKEQRKSFMGVSQPMLTLVKGLKLNKEAVFVQFCPMGKYTWLNEVKAVQNPYYGSAMYDCGSVTATLK